MTSAPRKGSVRDTSQDERCNISCFWIAKLWLGYEKPDTNGYGKLGSYVGKAEPIAFLVLDDLSPTLLHIQLLMSTGFWAVR
jgi:hypothetical protein